MILKANLEKLNSLLEGARIAMFTTLGSEGYLCSRPMALQQVDTEEFLWFFTGVHTKTVVDVKADSRVNVSVAHGSTYISISGQASVVENAKKASELWNPAYQAWFPKGLEDPDLTLLRVSIERAEYWDSPGGVVTTLIGYVKSLATGKVADIGGHGQLVDRAG